MELEEKFDWTLGLGDLPDFADEETVALYKTLRNEEDELSKSKRDEDYMTKRVETLHSHKDSILNEINILKNVADSTKKQLKSEEHVLRIVEMDIEKTKKTIKKDKARKEDFLEKEIVLKSEIFEVQRDIDILKNDIKCNEKELEAWIIARTQKEDDQKKLQGYMNEDTDKIRELRSEIDNATLRVRMLRMTQRNTQVEVSTRQIQLEKTIKSIEDCKIHQVEVASKIDKVLQSIRKTESGINKLTQKYALLEKSNNLASTETKHFEQEMIRTQATIKQSKRRYALVNSQLEDIGASILKGHEKILLGKEEIKSLEIEKDRLCKDVGLNEKKLTKCKQEIEKVQAQLNSKEIELKKLNTELSEQKSVTLSAENRSQRVEEYVDGQKRKIEHLKKAINDIGSQIYSENQDLSKFNSEQKKLALELGVIKSRKKAMVDNLLQAQKEKSRSEQVLYDISLRLEDANKKLVFERGERSEEEKKFLTAKIDILSKEVDEFKAKLVYLKRQSKFHESETKLLQQKYNRKEDEVKSSEIKLQENVISLDKVKELNTVIKSKLKKLFDLIQELRVAKSKRETELLSKRAELSTSILNKESLENRIKVGKLKLDNVERDLKFKLKIATEEKAAALKEKIQMDMDIVKLKNRFEVIKKEFPVESDDSLADENEERTQSYFIVRNAQKKADLQSKLAKLESKVSEIDKDISCLAGAANEVKHKNMKFRADLRKIGQNSNLCSKLEALESEVVSMKMSVEEKARRVEDLSAEEQRINTYISDAKNSISLIVQEKLGLEAKIGEVLSEVEELIVQHQELRNEMENVQADVNSSTNGMSKAIWTETKADRAKRLYRKCMKVWKGLKQESIHS